MHALIVLYTFAKRFGSWNTSAKRLSFKENKTIQTAPSFNFPNFINFIIKKFTNKRLISFLHTF